MSVVNISKVIKRVQSLGLYFKIYILDWIFVFLLVLSMAYIQAFVEPFKRRFSVFDHSISYPHIGNDQQYSDLELFLYTVFVPLLIIILIIIKKSKLSIFKFLNFLRFEFNNNNSNNINNNNNNNQIYHLFQITMLSFALSITLTGFLTEFLKVNIAKLRPDFLARCGVDPKGVLSDIDQAQLEDISICTKPFGEAVFQDGFKSCPSGHSSISFAGLSFLFYWLNGQFQLYSRTQQQSSSSSQAASSNSSKDSRDQIVVLRYKSMVYKLLASSPIIFALQVAISRSQDYRHDKIDILSGVSLGLICSTIVYFHFFPSLSSTDSDLPIDVNNYKLLDDERGLPL
ncbi:hypothetical protein B5S33_g3789 [[Candida] boidinii]|nr:hypothetical protein B5S33_g3789 [[Candida] boidinii]